MEDVMVAKSHDDLGWLEQLQLRATVAAEEQVDALKRIAVAIEQQNAQNAQNGPGYVLVKTAQVRKMATEKAQGTVARAQLARFVAAIQGVMNKHYDCEHADDAVLWLELRAAGEEVLGVGWVDSD